MRVDSLVSERVSVYNTAVLVAPPNPQAAAVWAGAAGAGAAGAGASGGPLGACVLVSVAVADVGRAANKVKLYDVSYTWADEDPRG